MGHGWWRPDFSREGDCSIKLVPCMCAPAVPSAGNSYSKRGQLQSAWGRKARYFPGRASWRASRLSWGMGEYVQGCPGGEEWQVRRAPSTGSPALCPTRHRGRRVVQEGGTGMPARVTSRGLAPGGHAGHQPALAGRLQAGRVHVLTCRAARQAEKAQRGEGDRTPGTPGLVCRAAPGPPDDGTLDAQRLTSRQRHHHPCLGLIEQLVLRELRPACTLSPKRERQAGPGPLRGLGKL